MATYNNCIRCAQDLITTHEQTRAGFIEAALEKNRKALPYIEDAKTLKLYASKAKTPMDLLNISNIRQGLLTASGLSDKSLKYFNDSDKMDAIKKMIEEFLLPAGRGFVDELVYRYLLVRGDSLGGSMRNLVGKIAEIKLKRKIFSVLSMLQVSFKILFKRNKKSNKWACLSYEEAFSLADEICAISWCINGLDKVLFFNMTIPLVRNNVDICLYKGTPATYDSGNIVHSNGDAIMFGELKGGIDPAGADEHWKTGNTALARIRNAFKGYNIKTSFVGAAIEEKMAEEIFLQLENNTLSNAANLTYNEHLTNYCEWLVKLQ
uniref:AvaI/BsoBI family type II restriction endonuclease n=1 Tax=Prevotella sp. TaxID=59823 RepID=UPI004027B95B